MYKVIKIIEYAATRDVELINEITGTRDICFDYSDMCFAFMKQGNSYDCKIALFGDAVEHQTNNSVECEVVRAVTIGNTDMLEISINKDIYYIYREDIINPIAGNRFMYEFTRKDLIQVNNNIHDRLL